MKIVTKEGNHNISIVWEVEPLLKIWGELYEKCKAGGAHKNKCL
jgi:hypothetical protein